MLRSLLKTFKGGADTHTPDAAPAAAHEATEAAPTPAAHAPGAEMAAIAPVEALPTPAPGSPAAIAQAQTWLAQSPQLFEALFELAQQLVLAARHAEAEPLLRAALRQRPAHLMVLHLLGFALKALGRLDEAIGIGRLAVAAEAGSSNTRVLLAQQLFLAGEVRQPFLHFRARAGINGVLHEWTGALRRWEGEPLAGQRLLVWLDWGGIGDELMFARYVPLLLRQYQPAELHWSVLPQNRRLLSMVPGVKQVFSEAATLAVDCHIALLDLPCLFGTERDSIPAPASYLRADPADSARWAARLAHLPGLKVGLCWASGHWKTDPEFERDRLARSVPLHLLAALSQVPGASVISLQKGRDEREWQAAGAGMHDFTAELQDMADTAALIENLDLVVSVDTSIVHLAGALGKPVLVLTARGIGLFWGTAPRTTPWYPSARLVRQARAGDWTDAAAQVLELVRGCAQRGRVAWPEQDTPQA